MTRSMTGYGLGKNEFFRVQIRSHNHRFCETLLRLPLQFVALEDKIREDIKGRVSRGRLQVDITYEDEKIGDFEIDQILAERLISSLRKIGESLGLRDDLSLGHLISAAKDIIRPKEKDYDLEVFWGHIKEALDMAIDSLLVMRAEEGKRLYEDILLRIKTIRHLLECIRERTDEVLLEYKERLIKRINELSGGMELDEHRLNLEVALFAERSDITEELVRLTSHLEQMEETLGMDGPIGKRLDFLTQELSREINTVASKTTNARIVRDAINIKDELEKIREQVQNVE